MAQYMNDEVPGVFIPEQLLKRMEAAGDRRGRRRRADRPGVDREGEGASRACNGIHLMAVGWEEIVPRIVSEAGLLPVGFKEPAPRAGEREEAEVGAGGGAGGVNELARINESTNQRISEWGDCSLIRCFRKAYSMRFLRVSLVISVALVFVVLA